MKDVSKLTEREKTEKQSSEPVNAVVFINDVNSRENFLKFHTKRKLFFCNNDEHEIIKYI